MNYGATANFIPWGPPEDRTLRKAYTAGGLVAAMAALPHRTKHSIFRRAQRLRCLRRRRWTSEDDRRLRGMWVLGEMRLTDIAKCLGRTKATTYWRAQKLGLPLGVPPGFEYLSHAAKRTGYTTGQLRRIMRAYGLVAYRTLARPAKRRGHAGSPVTWYVCPGDVDAAVESWLETEPLESAARRAGMCAETLARRLRACGHEKTGGKKAHWRVTPEQVEEALADRTDYRKLAARRRARGRGRFVSKTEAA